MGMNLCLNIFHKEYLVKIDRENWFIEYYFLMLWLLVQVYVNYFLTSAIDLFPHAFISPAMQE